RRRHTRFSRDWSSDVCSSDLQSLPSPRIHVQRSPHRGTLLKRGIVRSNTSTLISIFLLYCFIVVLMLLLSAQILEGIEWRQSEQIGRASCRVRVEVAWACGAV